MPGMKSVLMYYGVPACLLMMQRLNLIRYQLSFLTEIRCWMLRFGRKIYVSGSSLDLVIMEGQINELLLRIASYNCNSIRKSIDIVRHLLGNCDILVCQEIILLPEDIGFVQSIDI